MIRSPEPNYTSAAGQNHYGGLCVVVATIRVDGVPRDIEVAKALGMGLDEMAVQNVGEYRFKPAKVNGQPLAVSIPIEVYFED